MTNELKIMAWNANGLLQHRIELEAVLHLENIDICLISESHLTKESFILIKGYKSYHALHPDNKAKAGSSIIIKDTICHHEDHKFEEKYLQGIAVSVKTKCYPIIVSSIYCPPRYSLKVEQYKRFLETLGDRFILGGDFNAKNTHWGSRLTSTKGRELLIAIRETKCDVISTGSPTYWPTDSQKIPDLIDFFIYKNLSPNFISIEEGYMMSSDHSPILLTLSENVIIQRENNPTLVNKKTDWNKFKQDLEDIIDLKVPLKTPQQIDIDLRKFITDIQSSAWINTPKFRKRITGYYYPVEIRDLIAEKRIQRRKWQQTRYPKYKNRLNNLTKTIRRKIQAFKDETLNTYLSELTSDRTTDFSLWKTTRNIKKPITQNSPIRQSDGTWAKNNEQKAATFAQHLEKIFQPYEENSISSDQILSNKKSPDELEIKLVTPKEVLNEIKHINKKKSPGYDLITGEVLHNLPRKAIVKLTTLINAIFRVKHVPDVWKFAEVIMIPKPGKPAHETTSYRPISLLPIMSKLFEKLLLRRLKPVIEERKLIPEYQFGFREKHSTIDQVHRITNTIEKSLEEQKVCSAVFLDVAQAFDKVWHYGLMHKLRDLLPKQFAEIIESYLTQRMFRVRQGDSYSEIKQIKAGVPQGSVLGPTLYLLYTCDIPHLENNTIATFADDTAIMAIGATHEEAVVKVQSAIDKISEWTKKWRIKLNESKSVHVDFTNKNANYNPVYINGHVIPYENTAKYLGITLDAKLRWKAHVKKKREELELRYKKMYWLLGKHSSLSVQNKILLYKQVLMPVWTYGAQLWGCTKQSNIQIIQRFQNKVLKGIVNAPWYIRTVDLHRDLKMDVVVDIIKKHAEAHEHRLHRHVNVEAIQLLDNTDIVRRLKRTKPFELV